MLSNKLLAALSVISLIFLVFVLGAAGIHYNWAIERPVNHALEAADALYEEHVGETRDQKEIDALSEKDKDPVPHGRLIHWDKAASDNGYTLITVRNRSDVYLIDMEGHIVYTWSINIGELIGKENHPYLQKATIFPNGDLLASFNRANITPYGAGMAKIDKNSKVLWLNQQTIHHDFYVEKATGNIYTLNHKFVIPAEKGFDALPEKILGDNIYILSPGGKSIDTIKLFDAFMDTPFQEFLHYKMSDDKPIWDYMHTNTIMPIDAELAKDFPQFKAGEVMVSMRNMNLLAVVDPQTRKVVWAQDGPWRHQHDAHLIPGGDILLFDNEGRAGMGPPTSRILQFSTKTGGIVWEYHGDKEHPFYSYTHGRVTRLANGDTLIAESNNCRILEVTPDKQISWEYALPGKRIGDRASCSIYTAERYHESDLPFLKAH